MIRTVFTFFYIMFYLIFVTPKLLKVRRINQSIPVDKHDQMVHEHTKKFAQSVLKFTGSNVLVRGERKIPEGPVIIISNHDGHFDIPVLLGYVNKPAGFFSKESVKKLPLVYQWMEAMNCIFVDRKNMRKAVRSLNDAIESLKAGHSMIIFPEGTRSKGKGVGKFETGAFRMAKKANVPILPVALKGTYDMFEKNQGWKLYKIKPTTIQLEIGTPIMLDVMSEKTIGEISDITKGRIEQMLNNF
ncbi:lysophospholipid acyltransferase family protein [Bacillus carboniphilus]|uniref:1-acyl-sn-glycerol-3-phosphate acyltransferase n=1 Tax=Bacillus carboniphilus TaxID=86663 RepID=A0ABY9JW94_9BACI|nr:lysophospholipid acyltransferase family protein [Bacillus carboniphilus]WLR43672.1 lysophospholipid acyltransferase family protein [Bacillus carboniphilus]